MNVSDLCMSPFCGDVALPGYDHCHGCRVELEELRAQFEAAVAQTTREHEEAVISQDEVAA